MEGEWKESKIERLDEGIWARRACSHLHTLPALRLSQSPAEEAPVSLPQSSPSTPLSLAVSFIPPSLQLLSPRPPRITPQAGVLRQTASREGRNSKTEGADQEAKPSPCMGRGRGRPGAGTPSSRGNTAPCLAQVFDTITSYLPRVDIQLFLRLSTQNKLLERRVCKRDVCSVGGGVKVNLIGHVYSGRGAENICIQWHGPICCNFGSHFHLQER